MTGGSLPLRRLAFAGRWYTGDPIRLAEEVDAMLASAARRDTPARAVISPHAGLRYSGPVAAWSYSALAAQAVDAVILVGPSHYQAFRGCAMLGHGAVETPWRPLPIAEDLANALARQTALVRETGADIHAQEHSLELQLPFLARVLPEVPIVPILMGEQTRDVAFGLGDAIADIAVGSAIALVASSDLSHYENRVRAQALDAQVLEALDRCDANLLMDRLEREPRHACGGGPMAAVLRAATRLGTARGGVLKYADSGDVTGDTSQVVGYVAAAYGEK
jgi:AmmeMemoRadiSam system protein B